MPLLPFIMYFSATPTLSPLGYIYIPPPPTHTYYSLAFTPFVLFYHTHSSHSLNPLILNPLCLLFTPTTSPSLYVLLCTFHLVYPIIMFFLLPFPLFVPHTLISIPLPSRFPSFPLFLPSSLSHHLHYTMHCLPSLLHTIPPSLPLSFTPSLLPSLITSPQSQCSRLRFSCHSNQDESVGDLQGGDGGGDGGAGEEVVQGWRRRWWRDEGGGCCVVK